MRSSSREATESTDNTPSLAAAIDTDKMTEQVMLRAIKGGGRATNIVIRGPGGLWDKRK